MSPEYSGWLEAKKKIGDLIDAHFEAGNNGVPREKLGEGGFCALVIGGEVKRLVLDAELTQGVLTDARKEKSSWHHVLPRKGSSKQRIGFYASGDAAIATLDTARTESGRKKSPTRHNHRGYRYR